MELAKDGIDALESFIKVTGLPTTLRELGIEDQKELKEIADSCHYSPGSYRRIMPDEILKIFLECF